MRAKSFQTDSVEKLRNEITAATTDDFKPTLAILFMGLNHDASEVGNAFSDNDIQLFAGNSWGEFTGGNIVNQTIAVMLLDLAPDAFYIRLDHFGDQDEEEVTAVVANDALERFAHPALMIVTSDLKTRSEEILETFESILGPEAIVVGAGAGQDILDLKNNVFTNDEISHKGMATLVLDGDRVSVVARATCGWKAVGAKRTITKSDGYWVHEIDGQPALDAIIKYIGMEDFDPNDSQRWQNEVNTLPMQLLREKGDPIMRPALMFDAEKRSVLCMGKMPEGSQVRFSLEPDEDVIDKVIDECRDLRDTEAGEADAIVYFTCVGRHLSFGPLMNREIKEVKGLWDAPLIGLLSSGEMARATGGKLEFNAITSCCVVLKEKEVTA